jgi:hypothetical protein
MRPPGHLLSREAAAAAFTLVLGLLLVLIYGLMAIRLVQLEALTWSTKVLLIVFPALPPPLCFLLVQTYTRMIEDERVQALSGAWQRCEEGFLESPQYRQGNEFARTLPPDAKQERAKASENAFRDYILQSHPGLAEMFIGVIRQGEEAKLVARRRAQTEIRTAGLNERAYDLPILFFSCAYLIGLELVIPLLESYAIQGPVWPDIALGKDLDVPLMVLQVGFLGGATYAAFTLISRFLSRDITPRLFMVSGVRLILAPVGATILYLSPFISVPGASESLPMSTSPSAVLAYFVAGGFPFALLWTKAENLFSRLEFFKQRLMAGKRSTTLVEGITVFVAQRLSEEGIDVIQHLAFCDPADMARRTRYAEATVADWKDQAILYLLTGDCVIPGVGPLGGKDAPPTLYDLLDYRAGIRTASGLVRRVWAACGAGGEGVQVRPDIELFFRELGLLPVDDPAAAKPRCEGLAFLFLRLCEDAAAIQPALRTAPREVRPSGPRPDATRS